MQFDISVFHDAARAFENKRAGAFTSLSGSSGALLFSLIKTPTLLLFATETAASQFHKDTLFWSGLLNVRPPLLIQPEGDSERAKNVSKLYKQDNRKIIASVDAALAPVWSRDEFPCFSIAGGLLIERDEFIADLAKQGYLMVPVVSMEGEMSLRGGILDIFPPDREKPLRIEFFGDKIESLRSFDIDTQLSDHEMNNAVITPAIEPEGGQDLIKFSSGYGLIIHEPDDVNRRFPELYSTLLEKGAAGFTSLPLEAEGFNTDISGVTGFGLLREERKTIDDFAERVAKLARKYYILMVCSSEGQVQRLKDLFFNLAIDAPLLSGGRVFNYMQSPAITLGELNKGFSYKNIIVLAESDIFGKRPSYKPAKKSRVSNLISSIEDFQEGDYIVHMEHGIGRYMGLKKERIEGSEDDFIIIEYLEGGRLYVPLDRINVVQKYSAPGGRGAKLDRLGSKTWQKTKTRVKKKIKDMAEKLIKIYARRKAASGYAFSEDSELHREFDNFFPYEATPDQLTSINEIKKDMEKHIPMDRLLCGDVGYGKTEVIMRACFKAAYDSKQVAVLVPTTILAEQHYETFTTRFSSFPIKIDFLNRFKTGPEKKETLRSLAAGDTSIIIGTHALLAKTIKFYDLWLLVIDEEHKFGVTHKEKIKALRTNVDVLTLSATPIPRTMHMALSGIRGMSTIETPPEERMAVKSSVVRYSPTLIKEAVQHEIDRDGQVFFVHNRVHDIYEQANFLRTLVPEARVGVAHGQMHGKELESVMHKFFQKELNILVSTSIISSGLDIPSANTIMINRADHFGLADLYQLKGRVGRSNIKAYAYFIVPDEETMSSVAREKLQAIQEMNYLGAGFRLAMKDLEIRGAGNLLGAEQSGHIGAIGFSMYMEMLETAVAELKGEELPPSIEPVVDLKSSAVIPDEYIENPEIKLSIYRKISSAKDTKTLHDIHNELKDRFGPPPEKTSRLIDVMELKVLARQLYILKIINTGGRIRILFAPETPVSPEDLFALHETRKGRIKFLPEGGIELGLKGRNWDDTVKEIKEVMKELGCKSLS